MLIVWKTVNALLEHLLLRFLIQLQGIKMQNKSKVAGNLFC